MSNLSKREKIMVIVLIVLLVGFLYYRYALTPQLNKLAKAEETLESNQNKLEELKVKEKELEKLKVDVQQISAKADEVSYQIPDNDKIPEIIICLRDITNSSGCTTGALGFGNPVTQNINTDNKQGSTANTQSSQSTQTTQNGQPQQGASQEPAPGSVIILPLNYAVQGDYYAVMRFLSLVENNKRMLLVSNMTIGKDAKTGMLSVGMAVNTLYRKSGDPDQPITYPNINLAAGKASMFN